MTIMTIKVLLESNCSGCKATLNAIREAAAHAEGETITVEAIEELDEILKYNVWNLPAVIIDGKTVSVGKRLNVKQAAELINAAKKSI